MTIFLRIYEIQRLWLEETSDYLWR